MTLTLHKSQVQCSGAMQWWDCRSLVPAPLLAESVQGYRIGLFRWNFINLSSFQIGWPRKLFLACWHHLKLVGLKKFIWPFVSFLAFLRWKIYLWRKILLFHFLRQHKTFLINAPTCCCKLYLRDVSFEIKFSRNHWKYVYCVVCIGLKALSRLSARRLVCLLDINATMMSKKWKGSYDSVPKYSGDWKWLSHGCRKVTMDQYANCSTIASKVCNLTVTNHEKSEKHQSWASIQCQNRLNLNFEKKFLLFLVIRMFLCDEWRAISQIKFGCFSGF